MMTKTRTEGRILHAVGATSRRLLLQILLILSVAIGSRDARAGDQPAVLPIAAASAPSTPPAIHVKCVRVKDSDLGSRLTNGLFHATSERRGTDGIAAHKRQDACPAITPPEGQRALVGTGDLEVVISADDYRAATEYGNKGHALVLYVNGVPLPSDGQFIAVEQLGSETHLRYRINQGEDSQVLWAMIYRDKGLLGHETLRTALGWLGAGPGSAVRTVEVPDGTDTGQVLAITSKPQVITAVALLLLLCLGLYALGHNTDALRDASLPDWWSEARGVARAMNALTPDERVNRLQAAYEDFDPTKLDQYRLDAKRSLDGNSVLATNERSAFFGLVLLRQSWAPVRASFSLGRVQLAVWFAFAIAAGLFLWVIYGQLRRLDGSLLALLVISVGTAGVSLGVDRNAGGREYTPTKGFFTDLVTGFDNNHQVHRYQAVVINSLLLFVGISHVLQQLTYPLFDATWLSLLGISGAANGLGKQMLENPQPERAGIGGTPTKVAPSDGAVG